MNVKELFENEELMNSIVEDIDDIPEDSDVVYSVWGICYDREDDCIDSYFIKEFADPDEAVEYAKNITTEDFNTEYEKPDPNTVRLSLEVETVVAVPDEECTMNVGTIYTRDLWVDGEYGSEENVNPFISLTEGDYEILEDNTVKVPCKLLKDFNKNDLVRFYFTGSTGIDCQIVSKVVYEDGDYYHCEMMF